MSDNTEKVNNINYKMAVEGLRDFNRDQVKSTIQPLKNDSVNSLNDIMAIEGLRDFYRDQVNETIYPYLMNNALDPIEKEKITLELLKLNRKIDNLPSIYLDNSNEVIEKYRHIEQEIDVLYNQLSDIQSNIEYVIKKQK